MFIFPRNNNGESDNISILIKTFQRPRSLNRTIKSIRRFYPNLAILVADDSREPTPVEDRSVQVYRLPFDSGISRGRNLLLSKTETDLIFLMDDDVCFTRKTNLSKMREILEKYDFDILGCLFYERSMRKKELFRCKLVDFNGNLVLEDGVLKYLKEYHEKTEEYISCDLILNIFLAKTESIKAIGGWDEALKIGEHAEFFIRAKSAGLKVGYTPLAEVRHSPIKQERFSEDYKPFRTRLPEFRKIWLAKHGIQKVVKRDGSVFSAAEYIQESIW